MAVGALVFVLWIGKLSIDREFALYDVVFEEAVTGLSVGGPVHYNGIQVGEVRRLKLAPDNPSRVIARIRLGADTPVKVDTVAKLGFQGLTGVAFIQLTGGSPEAARLWPEEGQEAATLYAQSSDLQRLLSGSEDVVSSVIDVLLRLSAMLSPDNVDKVGRILDHTEHTTQALAQRSDELQPVMGEAAGAARQLRVTLEGVADLMGRLARTVDRTDSILENQGEAMAVDAREAMQALRRLTSEAADILASNRDAIDSFTQHGLGQSGAALMELRQLLHNLSRLAERLEEDPSRLIMRRERPQEFRP